LWLPRAGFIWAWPQLKPTVEVEFKEMIEKMGGDEYT